MPGLLYVPACVGGRRRRSGSSMTTRTSGIEFCVGALVVHVTRTRAGWLIGGALLMAGAAFVAAQDVPGNKGEQVMSASSLNCHDIRPTQITALDKDGWNGIV